MSMGNVKRIGINQVRSRELKRRNRIRCAVEAGNPQEDCHRMDVSLRSLQRPRRSGDALELAWQGRWMYAHPEIVKYIKGKEKAAHNEAAKEILEDGQRTEILR